MFRYQASKLARVNAASCTRSFSMSTVRAGEGDTGAVRPGGSAASDAFNKREQQEESLFIREKEMESLRKLREKLKTQKKHLEELDGHITELEKQEGWGE